MPKHFCQGYYQKKVKVIKQMMINSTLKLGEGILIPICMSIKMLIVEPVITISLIAGL